MCVCLYVCVFSPISGTGGDRQSGSGSSLVGVAVGVSVAIIIVLASIVTLVVWRRRNPRKRKLVAVIQSSQPFTRENEYTDGEYRTEWEDVPGRTYEAEAGFCNFWRRQALEFFFILKAGILVITLW